MTPKSPLQLSNHEVEVRAVEAVIAFERAAGRAVVDLRYRKDALVDLESYDDATDEKRLIEIKAFGGSGRGDFLWLERNQVRAFEQDPLAHLYLVTNVRAADPSEIRILDLTGEQLKARLAAKKLKQYFEVPLPVAVYDDLLSRSPAALTLDGVQFCLQILDGVVALHERGFHRARFVTRWAPTGLHVRLFVGRREDMLGTAPEAKVVDSVVHLSVDDSERAVREFAGALIPARWGRDRVADQLLSALPPMSPTGDDPEYQRELRRLLDRHRAAVTFPLTDRGEA
ncbi:DUF3883 domain-containing protein [Brachybacterium sp. J144]|uniref:protein NO VEIN domain-containing protein n=1 Tax=Brachybacterium sp. J144 TaxID=3116487 RepID=UPI002E78A885|nr:DUF3883 domain-containing protein [Brachybacterium sp. J144]MEE1650238.1 DUF3883 domain-containing protein [Brachybacterium sp. J144]